MARVPVYSGPQAEAAPLPNARQNVAAPDAAFGSVQAQQLQQLGSMGQKVALEAKQEADRVSVLNADTEAERLESSLTYGEGGYTKVSAESIYGPDADRSQPFVNRFAGQYDTGMNEIRGRLRNDAQRAAFDQLRARRLVTFEGRLSAYDSQMITKYKVDTGKAAIDTAGDAIVGAYNDPVKITEALTRLRAGVSTLASAQGWASETTQSAMRAMESKALASAVDRALDNGQPEQAANLELQFGGLITAQDKAKLEKRNQILAARREVSAERAVESFRNAMLIGDIDPLTISQGLDAVKGTPYEAAYRALIPQAEELQQQRRLPFQQRQEAINQIQVGVSGSPSSDPAEARRLVSTLQGGLDSDLKLAKEDPWQFRRLQTGEEPTVLDMSLALQPAGRAQLGGQLQARITAMRAMQRRYGLEVKFTPFTPAETNALQAVLERADDQSKLDIMSTFAGVARDGREFGEIVTPLAATQPLLKEAANAHRLQLQTSEGRRLGITILQGQRILQDESRKALLPDDTALQRAFSDYVGSALPAGSPDRDSLFNVFRATYAEVARSKGLLNKSVPGKVTINEDAKDIALSMATGGVVSYNGSKVLPPYGMSQEKFTTKVNDALRGLELPANMTGSVTLEPVVNRGGAYYLTRGLHRMAGPDGRPLEVQIK